MKFVSSGFFSAFLFLGILLPAGEITLLSPHDNAVVPQLNAVQKEFLALPRQERVEKFADHSYRTDLAKKGGYCPVPVTFSWKSDLPGERSYTVTVSETADFAKPITVTTKQCKTKIDNFKIAQKYYWKVISVPKEGESVASPVFSFTTGDQAPRLLRIDSIANVRDLGGRKAMDGKRVRQGMAIRSGGLNDNAQYLRASSKEELFDKKPELRLPCLIAEETLKNLMEAQKAGGGKTFVSYALNDSWTLFFPMLPLSQEMMTDLASLTRVPKYWKGCNAQTAVMEKEKISFPDYKEEKAVVLMQEFESPADGVMTIGAGADWFWLLWINGKLMQDCIAGNGETPGAENYSINLPVKKGKNILIVYLKSGSAGWSWHCAKAKSPVIQKNYADSILREKNRLSEVMQTPISDQRIVPGKNRISPQMREMLVEQWGIRTDLDLRSEGDCFGMKGSPIGEPVRWVHVPSYMYDRVGSDPGREAFREVFKVFLDKANYPILFHGVEGQDRTGAVAFILNGLLGVEEEELYKDWECSGFMNSHADYFTHARLFNRLVEVFDKYPGKNLNEKIENYVISLGFMRSDIEKFRSIMLE